MTPEELKLELVRGTKEDIDRIKARLDYYKDHPVADMSYWKRQLGLQEARLQDLLA